MILRKSSLTSILFVLTVLVPSIGRATQVEQTIDLIPGWNAIHLEVRADVRDPATVFAGCPVESVWFFADRESEVQFLVDPSFEALRNQPGWHAWFEPTGDPVRAELTDLFAVQSNRSYLVKLGGGAPCSVAVRGRPRLPRAFWRPDGFTLTGFAVEPGAGPTFESWFSASPAHQGQPIFALSPAGIWEPVDPVAATVESGRAYWVYTSGGSNFAGPLEVDLGFGDAFDFGQELNKRNLTLRTAGAASPSVTLVPSVEVADPIPMLYRHRVETPFPQFLWSDLPSPLPVGAGQREVQLGVRRANLGANPGEGVLEIRDGLGARLRVPSSVEPFAQTAQGGGAIDPYAGLWVGQVNVDNVNQVQAPSADLAFEFELGGVRSEPDPSGPGTVEEEDRFVPLRSNWRYEEFDGASLPADWNEIGFDDTGWSTATSEIGFPQSDVGLGDGSDGTVVPEAEAYYFRSTFQLAGGRTPADYERLVVRLLADDGATVFLNGRELVRANMPGSFGDSVAQGTRPLEIRSGEDELYLSEYTIPPTEAADPLDFVQLDAAFPDTCADGSTPAPRKDPPFDLVCDDNSAPSTLLLNPPGQDNVLAVAVYQHEFETAAGPQISGPTPVARPFSFRVLMHVDTNGQPRLVKEVVQMWADGTTEPDPDNPGFDRVAQPGRYVLVTSDDEILNFRGSTLRDGQAVGVRVSAAAYDYDAGTPGYDGASNTVAMGGSFDPPTGSSLQVSLVVPRTLPTNPFRHRKHPDHDDFTDAGFEITDEAFAEVYTIGRTLDFTFVTVDPNGARDAAGNPTGANPTPGFQSTSISGVYQETVFGLHRDPIVATGTFRLTRASTIAELNQ